MAEADEVKAEVRSVIFDLNSQLKQLNGVLKSAQESGNQLMALKTHNVDVALTAGRLLHGTPVEIEHLVNLYRIHIQSLEHFLTEVL